MKQQTIYDDRHFKLDTWQKKVLKHKGDIALRCGRQTGKTTAVALKARKLAYEYPKTTTLILSASLRQSSLLYEKVRAMLEADNVDVIKKKLGDATFSSQLKKNTAYREAGIFKDKEPTKTRIRLKNGSQIICDCAGESGAKVRGYTVDFLVCDESQEIPEKVFVAIIPMLMTSKKQRGTGWRIILGTPKAKSGFFYNCFQDRHFKHIHVSSEKCKRTTKGFLNREKKRLSSADYSQEYLAEWVGKANQYFNSALVDKCATLSEKEAKELVGNKYLGVDVARVGKDLNAYCEAVVVKDKVYVTWVKTDEEKNTTATMGFIKNRDDEMHYSKIYVDSGGLGGVMVDVMQTTISKKRIIGINNSSLRFHEAGEEKKKGILKEDLYLNAKILMESGRIKMIKNPYLVSGLKGVNYSYGLETGKIRIGGKGKGSHIVESFVRACWGIKDKSNSLWVY